MSKLPYEARPYDPDAHGAFVMSTWGLDRALVLKDLLRKGGRCLVATVRTRPDLFLGWAAVDRHGSVIWAYTKRGIYRRRGLMTSLLLELGADMSRPTPCLFWSPDAEAIAARGYHIFPIAERRAHERRLAEGHGQVS